MIKADVSLEMPNVIDVCEPTFLKDIGGILSEQSRWVTYYPDDRLDAIVPGFREALTPLVDKFSAHVLDDSAGKLPLVKVRYAAGTVALNAAHIEPRWHHDTLACPNQLAIMSDVSDLTTDIIVSDDPAMKDVLFTGFTDEPDSFQELVEEELTTGRIRIHKPQAGELVPATYHFHRSAPNVSGEPSYRRFLALMTDFDYS